MDSSKEAEVVDRTARNAWSTLRRLQRRRDEDGIAAIEVSELEHLVRGALRRAFPDVAFELFYDGAGWGELEVSYTSGPGQKLVELVVEPFGFDECHGVNWLLPDGRMAVAWRTDIYGEGQQTDCPVPGSVLVAGGPADVVVKRREVPA